MIDRINVQRHEHILTIEDPIEFLHTHKNCVVSQRELGTDTNSFAEALRSGLRQDPDIVLVGEMRDLETIEMALRVAETGHLTLATLHTNTAASTITRVIDVFPANQQPEIRTQLSNVLEGIMCQALLPNSTGDGRVMAMEILIPNSAVRNLIREDKIHQIYSMMQTGSEKFGMQTLNQSLAALYRSRRITLETAVGITSNPDELLELVGRGKSPGSAGVASPLKGQTAAQTDAERAGKEHDPRLSIKFYEKYVRRKPTIYWSRKRIRSRVRDQIAVAWNLARRRRSRLAGTSDGRGNWEIDVERFQSDFNLGQAINMRRGGPGGLPISHDTLFLTTVQEFSERTRILALDGEEPCAR